MPRAVCRDFGISRKTGYKIFNRYKEQGLEALNDRCRRPVRYANQLPPQIESLNVSCKREKPHWGARKIRELLVRRLDHDVRVPAKRPVHPVLHPHGLIKVPAEIAGHGHASVGCGRICMHRKKINITTVLAGQRLGIKVVDEGVWLVRFMHSIWATSTWKKTLQPLDNAFGPRLLPMSWVRSVT